MRDETIRLIEKLGDTICEECGPQRDCGIDISECWRLSSVEDDLQEYCREVAHK